MNSKSVLLNYRCIRGKRFSHFLFLIVTEDIRDVKNPMDYPTMPIWLYLLFFLLAVLVVVFLYRLSQRRRPRTLNHPPPETKTSWQKAFEALERLWQTDLLSRKAFDAFYFQLSNIVRQYIEERFYVRAPEMTTEEFLSFVKEKDTLSESHKEALRDFLLSCDMVKFAKYAPTIEEAQKSFDLARRFVEETKSATSATTIK